MTKVQLLDSALASCLLSQLRDQRTSAAAFRQSAHRLSLLLTAEASKKLETKATSLTSPTGTTVVGRQLTAAPLIVPVLRAGLSMSAAVSELLPEADLAYIGYRRNERTLLPELYLDTLPADLSQRPVIICDPMLATGQTLLATYQQLTKRGCRDICSLHLIASVPGLTKIGTTTSSLKLFCAAVDDELNDRGWIIPGLGDAGDRFCGSQHAA